MALINRDKLLIRFNDLLGTASNVDIAVAWAGPGLQVETLIEHANEGQVEARIVVGLWGNSTEPATLRRLMMADNVKLRVVPEQSGGLFHPKFYRFRDAKRTVCWVGSANFTRGGFSTNTELVLEFDDRQEIGKVWFENLWENLTENPEPEIDRYEERYRPPRPVGFKGSRQITPEELPSLQEVNSWQDFVDALEVLNNYCHDHNLNWDVLGETHSYLHTIGAGRDVARRMNWANFTHNDRNILLGLRRSDENNRGAWGLLGNLRGAGAVVGAFTPPLNAEYRDHVLQYVHDVVGVENNIIETAMSAMYGIMELDRFGPAVASRILTLARPDLFVSVAGRPVADRLAQFAEIEIGTSFTAEDYGKLLEHIHATNWFTSPEPIDAKNREIWRCRAALVDAFMYIPVRNA